MYCLALYCGDMMVVLWVRGANMMEFVWISWKSNFINLISINTKKNLLWTLYLTLFRDTLLVKKSLKSIFPSLLFYLLLDTFYLQDLLDPPLTC